MVDFWAMHKEVCLPAAPTDLPPVLVVGGDHDLILDLEALHETAQHYDAVPIIMEDMAHDCMLVRGWACI